MLFAILTAAGILALVLGVYWIVVVMPETSAERGLRKRLHGEAAPLAARLDLLRPVDVLSSFRILDTLLQKAGTAVRPLQELVERSGLPITVGVVVLASVFLGFLTFAVVRLVVPQFLLPAVVGAIGAAVPVLVVRQVAARRMLRFEEQFPEAIDLIARSLRAGHALTAGLGLVTEELEEPVRSEFQLLHDLQNYGMPLPDALKNFARRVPILDARFFVTAVLTQREAGGNLSEVLDNLATLIRERFKIRRQVRVISAHGRITGWTLAFLPPVLAAILTIIAPGHMKTFIEDPLGAQLVVAAIVLQAFGIVIIRRIVDVEI